MTQPPLFTVPRVGYPRMPYIGSLYLREALEHYGEVQDPEAEMDCATCGAVVRRRKRSLPGRARCLGCRKQRRWRW